MPSLPNELLALLVLAPLALLGPNSLFWSVVGLTRLCTSHLRGQEHPRARRGRKIKPSEVAVVIAARNEEVALPKCVRSLRRIVKARQIYIASDGSSDATVRVALKARCRVIDIQPNGGKAKALARALCEFDLCETYKAILIQDADSEIDERYLKEALRFFDNPDVVAVAGHVEARWDSQDWFRPAMVFAAYRTRLYVLLQAVFRYGQSWEKVNVNYIAPGFASIYRSSALSQIDITRPGLVIEDFNMTFEVHRKRLGIVAYTPFARCSTEDPHRLRDYVKQVQRWYLGLWQTVGVHGFWPSRFSLALAVLLLDMLFIALFQLALPLIAITSLAFGIGMPALSLAGFATVDPLMLLLALLVCDYLLTVTVAVIQGRPSLLLHGFAFPFLRLLDVCLFLQALLLAKTRSDGSWVSPLRRTAGPADGIGSRTQAIFNLSGAATP